MRDENRVADVVEQGVERQASDRFPCPQCGAGMSFSPNAQSLVCAYCGHTLEVEAGTSTIKELDLVLGEESCSSDWGTATKVVHCDNCGADVVLEVQQVAGQCAFCGSSHVVVSESLPGIRPGGVVPFAISEERARQAVGRWLSGRFFAPSDLGSRKTMARLSGTYIPYWTYDADTHSVYSAQRGTHYWVTQPVTVNRNGRMVTEHRQVRKTRWQPVSGVHSQFFDDVLTHASGRLDSILKRGVGRFDLGRLVDYRPEYLSGFVAERYSITLSQGWERAREIIRDGLNQSIRRRIGGDEVRFLNFRTSYEGMTFKHILLPLWLSAYEYNGKTYSFLVNGQTGEVHGESPVSPAKVAGVVLVALLIVLALVYFTG